MQPQKFRFTKTNIQQLPFSRGGNDRPEYRDTALPGLVLRVGKTAKTYYLYKYNEHLKRHEKLKLGNHLQLIPDTARLKAMELLARGCSAQEMRRQSRSSTIEKLANEFYAEHVLTELRPHSQVQYERQIKRYIIPKWGRRDPASLTRGFVFPARMACLTDVAKREGPLRPPTKRASRADRAEEWLTRRGG